MSYPFNQFATVENIEKASSFIPTDDRDICVKVGQAIHNELGESGYQIWIAWLQQSERYNEKDMLAVWRSFKSGGGITIASLFHLAQQNGFVFAKNTPALSQAEIDKRKTEQYARQVEAEKAQARRKFYAEKSRNKIIPELLPTGDPMIRYFYGRGLGLFKTPDSIQYHPALGYWENGQFAINTPTIVSLITDIDDNVEAFHKIHITEDGHKASVSSPKKISTPINTITGCSIKFEWPDDVLYLAEGLETALAVWISIGKPTWCCLTAHGLETIIIPESVKKVFIMADKDRSGAGEKSADKLAQRLIRQGVTVHIVLPEQPIPENMKSLDWLDVYNMENVAA